MNSHECIAHTHTHAYQIKHYTWKQCRMFHHGSTKCGTHISTIISHACVHASHSHKRANLLKSIYIQCSMCMGTVFFSTCTLPMGCLLWSFLNFLLALSHVSWWVDDQHRAHKIQLQVPHGMAGFVCLRTLTERFCRSTCLSNNNNGEKQHQRMQ